MIGHPDPLVPCQSFHFGPRFQQAEDGRANRRPHIVAEVSSVVIERIPNIVPPMPSQASQNAAQGSHPFFCATDVILQDHNNTVNYQNF